MDCLPPWLSSKDECSRTTTTHDQTKQEISEIIYQNFTSPQEKLKILNTEKKCKNPCRKMTNTISLAAQYRHFGKTTLEFRFRNTVKIEKKIVVYTFFNFIIDVGSSLGLWLGLSALGITDLVIQVLMVAKTFIK